MKKKLVVVLLLGLASALFAAGGQESGGGQQSGGGRVDSSEVRITIPEVIPGDAGSYVQRGAALYSKNEYARAGADLKKVLQLNPNGADTSAPLAKPLLEALGTMGY